MLRAYFLLAACACSTLGAPGALGEPRSLLHDDVSRSAEDTDASFPVDAVFSWVDSTRPDWRQAFERETGQPFANGPRWNTAFDPELELAQSIKLVWRNMPWVRRVIVVAFGGQQPQPVNLRMFQSGRELTVHHEAIGLAPHAVFNSVSVESALHHIPGLSEHFIYLNDDMYVIRPLTRHHFFDDQRRPIVRNDQYAAGADSPFARLNDQTAALIGSPAGTTDRHVPRAFTISMLAAAEADPLLRDPWAATRACRVRYTCGDDEVYTLYAAGQLGMRNGTAVSESSIDPSRALRSFQQQHGLPSADELRRRHADVVCIEEPPDDTTREALDRALQVLN